MKIIDAHTHIFPDKISEKVSKSIGGFYQMKYCAPASVANLLKDGTAAGVSHSHERLSLRRQKRHYGEPPDGRQPA